MNNQSIELFKQAKEFAYHNVGKENADKAYFQGVVAGKFAELIVHECIQVCKSRVGNSDYNTGRMHCASDLKEHFGVE